MPSVLVVPVYVEVPGGFERSVMALESHLRRAGYVFHTCDPLFETLEQTKKVLAERDDTSTTSTLARRTTCVTVAEPL